MLFYGSEVHTCLKVIRFQSFLILRNVFFLMIASRTIAKSPILFLTHPEWFWGTWFALRIFIIHVLQLFHSCPSVTDSSNVLVGPSPVVIGDVQEPGLKEYVDHSLRIVCLIILPNKVR